MNSADCCEPKLKSESSVTNINSDLIIKMCIEYKLKEGAKFKSSKDDEKKPINKLTKYELDKEKVKKDLLRTRRTDNFKHVLAKKTI